MVIANEGQVELSLGPGRFDPVFSRMPSGIIMVQKSFNLITEAGRW
jgi:hypothetical protein